MEVAMDNSETGSRAQARHCQVCGSERGVETVNPTLETPCRRCGHRIWFLWESLVNAAILKPTVDVLTRESLDTFLDSVAIKPGVQLVLDLIDVQFMSSAVLGRLITLKKRVQGVGGRLTIRHVNADLLHALKTTRLDQVFDLEP
jgi:anti-anti-sigma factor